jgi:hypothetical protein
MRGAGIFGSCKAGDGLGEKEQLLFILIYCKL